MRKITIGLLAVLAGVLASCAAPERDKSPASMLVEYRRTGGIAGLDDHLQVDATGKATLTRRSVRSEFTIEPETLRQLRERLDKAGFPRMWPEYLPSGKGRDLFTYVITYQGRTVRTMDTAVPEALRPVLELLNELVGKGGKP